MAIISGAGGSGYRRGIAMLILCIRGMGSQRRCRSRLIVYACSNDLISRRAWLAYPSDQL